MARFMSGAQYLRDNKAISLGKPITARPLLIVALGLLMASMVLLSQVLLRTVSAQESQLSPINAPKSGQNPLPPDCAPDWQVVPAANLPASTLDALEAISVVSANDIWAVGEYKPGATTQTLAEHWNGSAWNLVSSPNSGTGGNYLTGVTALSASDVWAVGFYQDGAAWRTLAEHWNGSAWSIVTSANTGTGGNYLTGVTALSASDIWAVGYYYYTTNGTNQTLILHSTGGPFTVQSSPNMGSEENYLSAVAAIAANNIWAVGHYTSAGIERTLTLHWDGSAWSIVTSPNVGTSTNSLRAVAPVSATDVWATGAYQNSSNIFQTLILRWNGSAWSTVTSPNAGSSHNYLNGATVVSGSNVWAVGYSSDGGYQALIEHWNGSAWSIMPSPVVTGTHTLAGIAAVSASDVWAAGNSDDGTTTRTLIERYNPCSGPPTPTATATPAICTLQFADVDTGNPFYPYIRCLACRGIISGYPCGAAGEPCNSNNDPYFHWASHITRGQTSKVVSNAAGFSEPVSTRTFEDVPPSLTFYDFIERLASRGIVSGYPCGGPGEPCISPGNRPYFRWANYITRGQAAKIIASAAGLPAPPSGQWTYQDVPESSTFWPWIEALAAAGAISGYNCGGLGEPCVPPDNRFYFRPLELITRGQAAKIVANTFFPGCITPSR